MIAKSDVSILGAVELSSWPLRLFKTKITRDALHMLTRLLKDLSQSLAQVTRRQYFLALLCALLCVVGTTFSTSSMAQSNCGKAPVAPKWMTSSRNLAQKNHGAVRSFLRKADRYLECQDRVNRSALQRLTPQQQRSRLNALSKVSQSRNTLQRRLNQSLAKQRTKNPF